jgi:hypothetical protein
MILSALRTLQILWLPHLCVLLSPNSPKNPFA